MCNRALGIASVQLLAVRFVLPDVIKMEGYLGLLAEDTSHIGSPTRAGSCGSVVRGFAQQSTIITAVHYGCASGKDWGNLLPGDWQEKGAPGKE